MNKIPHRAINNRDIFFSKYYGKDNKCYICKNNISKIQLDHVIPAAIGGMHNDENVKPICEECHNIKSGKDRKFINYLKKNNLLTKIRWKPYAYETNLTSKELEDMYNKQNIYI